MAYYKIILNGETLMDVTSDTVDAGNLLSGKTATKNSGAKITGEYPEEQQAVVFHFRYLAKRIAQHFTIIVHKDGVSFVNEHRG